MIKANRNIKNSSNDNLVMTLENDCNLSSGKTQQINLDNETIQEIQIKDIKNRDNSEIKKIIIKVKQNSNTTIIKNEKLKRIILLTRK